MFNSKTIWLKLSTFYLTLTRHNLQFRIPQFRIFDFIIKGFLVRISPKRNDKSRSFAGRLWKQIFQKLLGYIRSENISILNNHKHSENYKFFNNIYTFYGKGVKLMFDVESQNKIHKLCQQQKSSVFKIYFIS